MNNLIYPCLTLNGKVEAAADFYIHTFGDGRIAQRSPFVILIELSGQAIMLLNDGPTATPGPAISFMVTSETAEETERYWNALIEGGKAFMPLDTYPWSTKYGWVEDKYGVSWQLYTGNKEQTPQKFSPTLLFTGANAGKAREAIHLYTTLFPNSEIEGIMEYEEGEDDTAGFIKHAQFKLQNYVVMAMDSSADHHFDFNDAVSLVVDCDSQEEIDRYWEQLTANGGKEIACGWLTDRYGVSWQIIPKKLGQLISDPERGQRAMEALLKMKKLIIADLENA